MRGRVAALVLVQFVVLLALPILLEPAGAQQAGKVWRIGTVTTSPRTRSAHLINAFENRLRELGYVEGHNAVFNHRFADGKPERLASLATELVRLKMDVIVVGPNPAILAAKEATATIPVVMTYGIDPVGSGLVSSLARPGGNITGLTGDVAPETWGKRLQLLKEVDTSMSSVAVLWNPGFPGMGPPAGHATEESASRLNVKVRSYETRRLEDFETAFKSISRERVGGLIVIADPLTYAQRREIIDFAARSRLPAMFPFREATDEGGLISYGVNILASYRRAAELVDKILKGAKPADLPVEQPTKFELVINLKTAKALGLTIPPSLLLRADQVIDP